MPTRGKAWNSGVRAEAKPLSRPCQNGELADSASSTGRWARSALTARIQEHDLLLDADREGGGGRPARPGDLAQLSGSTHVSLPPPPCDELTTSCPSRSATRVSPPGSARDSDPSKKTKGRTSTWRGA